MFFFNSFIVIIEQSHKRRDDKIQTSAGVNRELLRHRPLFVWNNKNKCPSLTGSMNVLLL